MATTGDPVPCSGCGWYGGRHDAICPQVSGQPMVVMPTAVPMKPILYPEALVSNTPELTVETLRAQLPAGRKGRPMLAKYDGVCAACDVAILPGDPILYDGRTICSGCATDEDIDL